MGSHVLTTSLSDSCTDRVVQEEQVIVDAKLAKNLQEQEFLQEETTCHEKDVVEEDHENTEQ